MIQVKRHFRKSKNKVSVVRKHSRKNGIIVKKGDYSLMRTNEGAHFQHKTTYETSKNIADKKQISALRKLKVKDFNAMGAKHINRQF